jgi:hypothetical protein
MATLDHLVADGKLKKFDPDLEHDEFPERHVYMAPEADTWVDGTLRLAPHGRSLRLSPYGQVEQLLFDFVIGRPLVYDAQRKKLNPVGLHVWELKTLDVRLIGWFPRKRHFIVVCGRLKTELLKASLYAPCINLVTLFRNTLDLDPPKTITGVRHDDVL